LASEMEPFDAMEKAIVALFDSVITPSNENNQKIIHEYALNGRPPMMTHVYESGNTLLVAGKGAPERILNVCKMPDSEKSKVQMIVQQLASSGYRVLGICSATN